MFASKLTFAVYAYNGIEFRNLYLVVTKFILSL